MRDSTNIANISLKTFLASSKTKQQLTVYFSQTCLKHFAKKESVILYVSCNGRTYCSLSPDNVICENNHEEADTLIVWHAMYATDMCTEDNVARTEICVISPDSDVLVLLVSLCQRLLPKTFIKLKSGKFDVRKIHSRIGAAKANALLGMHAITGCDTVGN